MLEFIIAIFPGILAISMYRRFHQEFHVKKVIAYILLYTVITNLCILAGLKLIGMQRFNLFDMSARFKVKWIILELVLSLLITLMLHNISRLNLSSCRRIFIRLFPATLFLIVTYAVFTPSSLFLENINEFLIPYFKILPVLFVVSLILLIGLYLFSLCFVSEKYLHLFTGFLFALGLCLYIQGNFLNPKLPTLDGTQIDWSSYGKETIISISFWLLCIVLCLVLSFLQKHKTEKVIKYISLFLSAVQAVSLIVLIFTSKLDDSANYGYAKDGEFSIGTQENVIIFIVDTLQAFKLENYLTSEAYPDGGFDDFTFFDNVTAGGAPTHYALPVFLTGFEYDPAQPFDAYLQEMCEDTPLYESFHDNGYDIRFYTTTTSLMAFPEHAIDNYTVTGSQWIDDYPKFGMQLYKLTDFYLMPQFLKQYFWISDTAFLENITSSNSRYEIDDAQLYIDFQTAGQLRTDYGKAFRLYHLRGIHAPHVTDELLRPCKEGESFDEDQALQGNMKIIYEYLDQMKKTGVYEASTIIILGDHGLHQSNNIEDNPAVLIKRPYETHELTHNSAPVHFRNLTATLASCLGGDYSYYGPSFYDLSEESDVERLHTIDESIHDRVTVNEPHNNTQGGSLRLITYGRAGNGEYEVWDPYQINRINYTLGETIDFTAENEYAEQINYRLYKENGAATASNELSICFVLDKYQKDDVTLHFIYSNLYNSSQKIRFYANGNKVENIVCTPENIGKEMTVVIPEENLSGNELVIRMVFPNAVTPNQLDRDNPDMRVLSVSFDSLWLTQ